MDDRVKALLDKTYGSLNAREASYRSAVNELTGLYRSLPEPIKESIRGEFTGITSKRSELLELIADAQKEKKEMQAKLERLYECIDEANKQAKELEMLLKGQGN